jgi:DNA-binding winged helix-turn-helix (wHTH) protein/tetratricopeptide (TPR) repeat protein
VSFVFGEFELDVSTFKLRRAGKEISPQPKVFDAIRYLVENRDRVVRKEELLDALWPGQHVNEGALPWTICRARKLLGQDKSASHRPIETVRGRGYRFTDEVRNEVKLESLPASRIDGSRHTPAALSGRPASDPPPVEIANTTQSRQRIADPFVGRSDVMDRLFAALHDASGGRGRLCLLSGAAGIGKTRCINEFTIVAERLKLSVWSGRCLEGSRTAVFWPWVQVLGDALARGGLSAASRREMQVLLSELMPQRGATEPPADMDASSAAAARFWMLEKLGRLLLDCSESAPRVILLDDVHWADEASLDLFVLLAAELPLTPVLVIGTARDGEPSNSEAWSKAMTRLGPCERVELGGLKPSEVGQYVVEVTGLELPPEIPPAVHAKSGGNPLFLQETVRLLRARSARDGVQALRSEDITVPQIARDLVRSRLAGLAHTTSATLEIACVIGQEFDLSVLQGALAIATEPLLSALDEAVRGRLVAPRSRAGTYRFLHDTIREALYDELPSARRADLHLQVAQVLQEHVGEFGANELAYHYYRALPRADPARVERYTRMAGDIAMRGFAYEDATRFYDWALEAQRFLDVDPRRSCELLLARAAAARLCGQIDDARSSVAEAIAIARRSSFADLLLDAARKLRPSTRIAPVPDALALGALEDAFRLLAKGDRSLRIRVLGQLACIPPHSLSIEKSRELSRRAVRLARRSPARTDLTEALKSCLHALSGPDDIGELLEVTSEIVRLDPGALTEVGWPRYHALLHKGDVAEAETLREELGDRARSLRSREGLWHYERICAQHAFHTGDFEKSESAFRELFVQSCRMRLSYGKLYYMVHTIALAFERNNLTSTPVSPQELSSEFQWATAMPTFRSHQIRFLLELGRTEEARGAFEAMAQQGFEAITRDLNYLSALSHLSLAAIALEDHPRATALYKLMRPYPHHNTPNGFAISHGSVSYYLGRLAHFLGKPKAALAHFEDALVMNARLGFVPQLAWTQFAFAELLAETHLDSDHRRANALLSQAEATGRRLEMARLISHVERLRSRLAEASSRSRAR